MNELVKEIAEAIKSEKTTAYDTVAEVLRIDGSTAYVHIDGGADETPVQLTISCRVGDKVKIHVGGGKAWITGNLTAPPTDDKTAVEAKAAVVKVEQSQALLKQSSDAAFKTLQTAMESLNGLFPIPQTQDDGSTILYFCDKPTLEESSIVIKLNAAGWAMSTDGGESWNAGVLVDGTTITKILNTVGINAEWINSGALTIKDSDGNVVLSIDAETGKLITNAGKIGGWNISDDSIFSTMYDGDITRKLILHAAQSTTAPYIVLSRQHPFPNGDYSDGGVYFNDGYIKFHADVYTQVSGEKYTSELVMRPLGDGIHFWKEGSNADGDFYHNAIYNAEKIQLINGSDELTITPACLQFKNGVTISSNNNVLWNCNNTAYWMIASHKFTLNQPISEQLTGAVFVWSHYTSGTIDNWGYNMFFVPKQHVIWWDGCGIDMCNPYAGLRKYIYVHDTYIEGNDNNSATGSANGISLNTRSYILRCVIGV